MRIQAVITKKPSLHASAVLPIPEKKKPRIQSLLLIVFTAAGIGLISGVLLFYLRQDSAERIIRMRFHVYLSGMQNSNLSDLILSFLFRDLLLLLCCVLPGISLVGYILLPAMFALFCSGISALSCFLIQQFSLNGLGFFFVCLFPAEVIQMFALLMMVQNGCEKSISLRNLTKGESLRSEQMFRFYWQRNALGACLLFAASLISAVFMKLFMNLFFASV